MDKIEKIRAEIERLYGEYKDKFKQHGDQYHLGLIDGLDMAERVLDTLSEEPDTSLEEEVKRYYSDNFAYISSDQPTLSILTNIARHFAEWKAEQFEKNRLSACDALTKEGYDREVAFSTEIIEKEHRQPTFTDAINYGMQYAREQMLKDAVEGEIQMRYSGCLCAKTIRAINEDKFKLGDKVRIIIVKEAGK